MIIWSKIVKIISASNRDAIQLLQLVIVRSDHFDDMIGPLPFRREFFMFHGLVGSYLLKDKIS